MNIAITGSSSGIGRALLIKLLEEGHSVWGLARSDQSNLLRLHPKRLAVFQCDVADWHAVHSAAASIAASSQRLDALITCAAIHGPIGRTLAADPVQWSAALRTNLDGTLFAIRAFAPLLAKAERRAKVVCFSGGGASKARPAFSSYAVAKTGVVRLVETIAAEERGQKFDINAVAPGTVPTRLLEEIRTLGPTVVGDTEFAAANQSPDPTAMKAAMDLVEWLLSPASDGISGKLISARWDPWSEFGANPDLRRSDDLYTLRRVVPGQQQKPPR